ncbi:MAG: MCE family protein [Alphaproteobacteria bacterium]|nr:MCE family protein [Alphaproteobacteria bacterium]
MRHQPNKKSIGLFLVIGMVALVLIIGQTVVSKIFQDRQYLAVLYFDESIKGLNVGSPVVFNGVEIGKVVKIELIGNPQNLTFQVPVYIRLTPMKQMQGQDWDTFGNRQSVLDILIQKGLRARLLTQSYLTGQLMIELSMMPDSPVRLTDTDRDRQNKIPEIPTVLSPVGEISRGFQDLPVRQTLERMEYVMSELDKLMPVLNKSMKNIEKITSIMAPRTADTLTNVNEAFNQLADTMRSVRNLADYLEQYPEALLKGKR